jgi:purine-nucleoside phosphorylase
MLQKILETVEYLEGKTHIKPTLGIILGTGLGKLVDEIDIEHTLPYEFIPNFPVTTVEGHHGQLIFGSMCGIHLVAMQGRFHFYEGYTMQEIAFPIRVMKFLGVRYLIISNASGGLNPEFETGDIMVVEDHINLMKNNPLIGPNEDSFGARFPDMSDAYDKDMIDLAFRVASTMGIKLQRGVYAGVSGPTFETPAEYNYIRIIGADAVGMSTVPEVIAARHLGLTCFALSVITDLGVKGKIVRITHKEVIDAAESAEPKMTSLIKEMLASHRNWS